MEQVNVPPKGYTADLSRSRSIAELDGGSAAELRLGMEVRRESRSRNAESVKVGQVQFQAWRRTS